MRFLALFAVLLTAPLFGQKVVVNDDIAALAAKGVVSVAVVSDDPVLGNLVQFALSAHGAIQVSPTSSVKLRIGRTANTAVVACDSAAQRLLRFLGQRRSPRRGSARAQGRRRRDRRPRPPLAAQAALR
ncbi:MAG: hypothetical protein EBR70_03370 [Verrucomicrobia bacterium]|nr:hypothetical protein [Verrucomicrobiota bacterium]